MPDAVLYALVLVVALACPLHMWWANRRGKRALCCPPRRAGDPGADLDALRARQREVEARIAELDIDAPAAPTAGAHKAA